MSPEHWMQHINTFKQTLQLYSWISTITVLSFSGSSNSDIIMREDHHHQSLNLESRLGHHRWYCNPVLHCPLWLGELRACPFPDVVFPPLPFQAWRSWKCLTGERQILSRSTVYCSEWRSGSLVNINTAAVVTLSERVWYRSGSKLGQNKSVLCLNNPVSCGVCMKVTTYLRFHCLH